MNMNISNSLEIMPYEIELSYIITFQNQMALI